MAAAPAAQNGVFAMTKKQKKMLVRILITAVMLIALHFIPITGIPQLLAYVAAYLVIGYARPGRAFSMAVRLTKIS